MDRSAERKKTVRTAAGTGTMTAATDDTAGRMTLETFAVPEVTGDDHVRGPADAPVTVVEYGDYECPYCRGAARDVDRMLEQFPGQVRFVFRNFPIVQLHPNAEQAAEAAREREFLFKQHLSRKKLERDLTRKLPVEFVFHSHGHAILGAEVEAAAKSGKRTRVRFLCSSL